MKERDIFLEALEKGSPEERRAFLDRACGADAQLRSRLELLLKSHAEANSLLDHPVLGDGPTEAGAGPTDRSEREPSEGDTAVLDFLQPSGAPGSLGRLGQYEVREVIGRGGMGIVLKANDTKLNRIVAVKVLAPELAANAAARKRFVREARAAAAVSHDHVVTIYAVEEDHLPYLAMEFIDGQSLQEKIDRQGQLSLKEILRIGQQIAAGLAAAHGHGIIHRDIKPANILLQNGIERVQITDFGLARAVDDVAITRSGEVAGTPQFMSPEQAQGQGVDPRTDLFSLGSVLYTMCTGRPPFRADTTVAVLRRVCDDAARPIRQVNPDVPGWLAEIIQRLLAKQPENRFQTAAEVAELLGRHLAHVQDPGSTPFPSRLPTAEPGPGGRGRRRRSSLVAALILATVVGSLAISEATGVTRLAATVIRMVTGEGTLVVRVDDPEVSLTIDGEELVLTGAGPQQVRLKPGQYEVEATKGGRVVKQDLVTIERGGRRILRVAPQPFTTRDEPLKVTAMPGSTDESACFEKNRWTIWRVAFAPDDRTALSLGGPDVLVWQVPIGKLLRRFSEYGDSPAKGAQCGCFFPGGRRDDWIVVGGHDGAVRVLDFRTGDEVKRFQAPGRVTDLAVSPDSRRILTGTSDGKAIVWDVQENCEESRHQFHSEAIRRLAISPDGSRALTAGYDDVVCYWDVQTGHVLHRFTAPDSSVAFSPDGRHALMAYAADVLLMDLKSGEEIRRLRGHTDEVSAAAFGPDGRRAVSGAGGSDLTVRVWDVETGEQLARFTGHKTPITDVAISHDGHLALSGSLLPDPTVRLWLLPDAPEGPAAPSMDHQEQK